MRKFLLFFLVFGYAITVDAQELPYRSKQDIPYYPDSTQQMDECIEELCLILYSKKRLSGQIKQESTGIISKEKKIK